MENPFNNTSSLFVKTSDIQKYLQEIIGRHLILTLTDNTSSMISIRLIKGVFIVRLQRIFLTADTVILDELARFIINKKTLTPNINAFIREKYDIIKLKKTQRTINIRPIGRYHNLIEIYNQINEEYFEGMIPSRITWGKKPTKRLVKTKILGSYNRITDIITINQTLDSKKVPLFYLSYIVYHEMLHAHLGVRKKGKRYLSHTKKFREQEQCFIDYKLAIEWQKNKSF